MSKPTRLARIPDGTSFFYALDRGDGFRKILDSVSTVFEHFFQPELLSFGEEIFLPDVLLPPVEPTKIVCVGLNYLAHANEQGKAIPPEPLLFMKPTSALTGHGSTVILPPQSELVHHEGELAVVIGKHAKNLTESEVVDVILGYTCANDVSARDIQRREKRYTRAKGFDTFCPLGPFIVSARDFFPENERLSLFVNDELRQDSPLSDFIFDVPRIVSFISQIMTLNPGDVILTGTPSGVAPLADGDAVRISISNLGTLSHDVRRQDNI